jgi:SAM-dependent methyltransferase
LQWDVGTVVAKSLLDRVQRGLSDGLASASDAMTELFTGLYVMKSSAEPQVWSDVARQCVDHPVLELIHQDPFTERSFKKPRGYAGDAVLIDYIYTRDHRILVDNEVSELGELIFNFTTGAPASAGVRTRRDLMASVIDDTCSLIEAPQMLSIACGHLREATLSRSVANHDAGRFFALDQDELSLAVVTESMPEHGIVPVCSSIKSLFRGELAGERFDLIYSTGLYDYLDDRIASKLTARLFDMLNPGGRLVLANFLPDIWCAGYMETFMGWNLIYRSPDQMLEMSETIPQDEIADRRVYTEKNANIVFLDVHRQ